MKCICGNSKSFVVAEGHTHNAPDKYEKWVGIPNINRCWARCATCGMYIHFRNYDLKELDQIYANGYRDKEFRGESIEDAYKRIMAIEDSENHFRYVWFGTQIKYEDTQNILDVGSGIGVWPAILKKAGFDVDCVEENETSINFLYENLGFKCFKGLDKIKNKYDCVSLIHVLEHIESPVKFLKKIKEKIRPFGNLFVEVPDDSEFTYLPPEHDEFNSCHVAFYNVVNLAKVLTAAGFTVNDIHIERTKQRNLTRIMCLAIN